MCISIYSQAVVSAGALASLGSHSLIRVILPTFLEIESWLWTRRTEVGQVPRAGRLMPGVSVSVLHEVSEMGPLPGHPKQPLIVILRPAVNHRTGSGVVKHTGTL